MNDPKISIIQSHVDKWYASKEDKETPMQEFSMKNIFDLINYCNTMEYAIEFLYEYRDHVAVISWKGKKAYVIKIGSIIMILQNIYNGKVTYQEFTRVNFLMKNILPPLQKILETDSHVMDITFLHMLWGIVDFHCNRKYTTIKIQRKYEQASI